jgi:hypothetical protein
MPTVHETAYPRLKSNVTRRELVDLYTPTESEVELSVRASKGASARVPFLILLKTFQRIGYFTALREVPPQRESGNDRYLQNPARSEYDREC